MKLVVLEIADEAMLKRVLIAANMTQSLLSKTVKFSSSALGLYLNFTKLTGIPDKTVTMIYKSLNNENLNLLIDGKRVNPDDLNFEKFEFISNDPSERMLIRRLKKFVELLRLIPGENKNIYLDKFENIIEEMRKEK